MRTSYLLLLLATLYTPFSIAHLSTLTLTYKTVGDLPLQADIHIPIASTESKYPVILAFHGGGFSVGTKKDGCTPQELQEMLSRGWCVVSINYRLAPAAFFTDIFQDIKDAYHWIRTELVNTVPINTDSISLLGASAGGGLALASGYMLSPRPQAIIVFYPGGPDFTSPHAYNSSSPVPEELVTKMAALDQSLAEYPIPGVGVSDPRLELFFAAAGAQKLGWMMVTHNPNKPTEDILGVLREYSAAYHVDSEYPPTAIIHGMSDTIEPFQQSVQFEAILKKAGVPNLLKLVPDVGHVFDFMGVSDEVWKEYILPAFDFVEQYIRKETKEKNMLGSKIHDIEL